MDLQGRELKLTLAGNDVQLLQTELTQIGLPVPDAERKNANFGEGTRKAVAQFQKDYTAVSSSLPSEHTTLTGTLAAHFKGSLRDLKETDDRQDITYLANKTGWDARAVALAALADQFSAKTKDAGGVAAIDPPFFYALLRAGIGANEDALYQLDASSAEQIWQQAIAQGVIPSALQTEIPQAAERFQSLAARRALDGPAVAGLSSLKQMLSLSLGDDPVKQKKFADLYTRHKGDPPKLWEAVRGAFGEAAEKRLRIDGQLGYLTLNNAPLIRKLHAAGGLGGINDTVSLARTGFYRAEKWRRLIAGDAIPTEIAGETDEVKRTRYAELLAAHVRLSFPTAVVAEMVKSGETPVSKDANRDGVHTFLTQHHGKFEIGMQPVQRYIARNKLQVSSEVTTEITRIQRVYQITPSDSAMNALLKRGLDSALAVSRYDRDQFVRMYKEDLGGEANARLTHAMAQQVYNAVFNLATSYLVARTAPKIGVHSPAKYADTTPAPVAEAQFFPGSILDFLKAYAAQSADKAADVIPYATLEKLFGEMDYCSCEHCRSVLSQAAYLVDLLHFLDREDKAWTDILTKWKSEHQGVTYPFARNQDWVKAGKPDPLTPLQVLLERRPDIQHLPLTCENTNTPLPYIDLVNETLEYFVTNYELNATGNKPPLNGYTGHSTDASVTPEELLASPQFVQDTAYDKTIKEALFPPPLPFHLALENARRYFDKFEISLPDVMEAMRKNDNLERPGDPKDKEYGWRDILMEELRLSRAEYKLLTDHTLTIQQLYGFESTSSEDEVLFGIWNEGTDDEKPFGLSYAKAFTRRVGISYEEIVEILKTQFVNPNLAVVPKFDRLGVSFITLKQLKDGTIADAEFEAMLPKGQNAPDPTQYGGNVVNWLKNESNYSSIMGLITLVDLSGEKNLCSFDKVEFRYALPDNANNKLRPFAFCRLIRFVRLWKKLGWTVEQTDKAITALYPSNPLPNSPGASEEEKVDAGFLILLPRLGVIKRVMSALKLKPKKDLLSLLACFGSIDTYGPESLYRQMFLSPAPAGQKNPFVDDGYGNYLSGNETLVEHAEALRSAFQLSAGELKEIADELKYDKSTLLKVGGPKEDTISPIFRRGWLTRKLKLSVREFLDLTRVTGIDPFASPDPPDPTNKRPHGPSIMRFLDLVNRLHAASLKPEQALYLIWNKDISGKSAPGQAEILEFARTLRGAFAVIESEFALVDDPDGSIARARMSLVYGSDATAFFFGLLDNTFVTEVEYDHPQPTLQQPILDATPGRIGYDDFRKRLSFSGRMSEAHVQALQAVAGVTQEFKDAVKKNGAGPQPGTGLYHENLKVVVPFFERYPELQSPYDAYAASSDPIEKKRSDFLETILPELKHVRKRQQAIQAITTAAGSDITLADALLQNNLVLNPAVTSEATDSDKLPPALDDLTAMETAGLSADFFHGATIGATADASSDAEANLDYSAIGSATLPFMPASAVWSGYLEVPENGFYNFYIERGDASPASAGLTELTVDGADRPLQQNGGVWSNSSAIELRAGTLYPFTLKIENVTSDLRVRWWKQGRGREVVPSRFLYPATLIDALRTTYIRFLKAASLANALRLAPAETVHFAAHEAYRVDERGWLQRLPVNESPAAATSIELLKALDALIEFALLKAKLAPSGERLLSVLKDPIAAAVKKEGPESPALYILTRWEEASREVLLKHFGNSLGDLSQIRTFRRIYDAFALLKKLAIPAAALINAATNEPTGAAVRAFKAALRARYDETDWLSVLRPINDALRALQRDSLVAYILQRMSLDPGARHIDTADKLFEYFLMDVQMDPCMLTSRIRLALSSVQLFIDRCILNLEPRVAPEAFVPDQRKQWDWMKRYRVWEANRKIALWPENWLEPELRDDQSPIFREAMSELLQSDITEDRAATALLNYLSKLEEIAKLEPCGIHVVEPASEEDNQIVHVVARTAGANRKYFYRRREGKPDVGSGTWTPWELVKPDIEDNPVIPVVWKGRLFLFWLKILKQPPDVNAQAILCWSEYYNGKWQLTKTSDINKPTELDPFGPNDSRSDLQLAGFETSDPSKALDALCLQIGTSSSSDLLSYFAVLNTHSAPLRKEEDEPSTSFGDNVEVGSKTRQVTGEYASYNAQKFNQSNYKMETDTNVHDLPRSKVNASALEPRHTLKDHWFAPFFYWDTCHVFYVTPEEAPGRFHSWGGYYRAASVATGQSLAPVVIADQRFHGPGQHKLLPMRGSVLFGETNIAPRGRVDSVHTR